MKVKMKVKMLIDLLMTVVLLFLMSYQVTGEKYHEWLGVFMFVLFAVHNVMNIRWYGNLIKGKYRLVRVIQTIVNFTVLIAMLCLMYSGIIMSRYVFAALPINSGMALARVMHLSGSYWGFVLMSLHLGLHWGIIMGMFRKLVEGRDFTVISWMMRLFAVIIAGYGAFCFWQADIASYLFLKVEFVFIDYEKNAVQIFFQNISMMGLWIFMAYYMTKGIEDFSATSQKSRENRDDER